MAEAIIDIMMHTGMFTTKAITSASTISAPGNNPRAYKMPKARVAPTGAEKTALKIMASSTDASRTRPDDCRTERYEDEDGEGSDCMSTTSLVDCQISNVN